MLNKMRKNLDNEFGFLDMSLFEVEFYVLDYIIDSCLVLIFSNIKIYFFILK